MFDPKQKPHTERLYGAFELVYAYTLVFSTRFDDLLGLPIALTASTLNRGTLTGYRLLPGYPTVGEISIGLALLPWMFYVTLLDGLRFQRLATVHNFLRPWYSLGSGARCPILAPLLTT